MAIRVGTSRWVYRDWRGAFYPDGLPQRLWLESYATQFDTVEVNNAFYRLPRGAALAWADRKSRPLTPLWQTTDWTYLRLHEGAASPWPSYGRTALKTWAYRITEDSYVYFNNDQQATAPRNAKTFRRLVSG